MTRLAGHLTENEISQQLIQAIQDGNIADLITVLQSDPSTVVSQPITELIDAIIAQRSYPGGFTHRDAVLQSLEKFIVEYLVPDSNCSRYALILLMEVQTVLLTSKLLKAKKDKEVAEKNVFDAQKVLIKLKEGQNVLEVEIKNAEQAVLVAQQELQTQQSKYDKNTVAMEYHKSKIRMI